MGLAKRPPPSTHLFKDGELDGILWGNLEDVDAIASPQGVEAPLLDHAPEPPQQVHEVSLGGVHLGIGRPLAL